MIDMEDKKKTVKELEEEMNLREKEFEKHFKEEEKELENKINAEIDELTKISKMDELGF
jgi:septal ring factor EnvC (AmiA/AmiB activator)